MLKKPSGKIQKRSLKSTHINKISIKKFLYFKTSTQNLTVVYIRGGTYITIAPSNLVTLPYIFHEKR